MGRVERPSAVEEKQSAAPLWEVGGEVGGGFEIQDAVDDLYDTHTQIHTHTHAYTQSMSSVIQAAQGLYRSTTAQKKHVQAGKYTHATHTHGHSYLQLCAVVCVPVKVHGSEQTERLLDIETL